MFCFLLLLLSLPSFSKVIVDVELLIEKGSNSDSYTKKLKLELNKKKNFSFLNTPYEFSIILKDRSKQYPQTAVKTLGRPYFIKTVAFKKHDKTLNKIDAEETVVFAGKKAEIDFSTDDESFLEIKYKILK